MMSGGSGRRRCVKLVINGIERVWQWRKQHITVRVYVVSDIGVPVVGRCRKVSAESLLVVCFDNGKIIFPLIFDNQRLVIGQQFGQEADAEYDAKQNK